MNRLLFVHFEDFKFRISRIVKIKFLCYLVLFGSRISRQGANSEILAEQEGRIYHGATPQSIVTLHPRFELLLFTLRACYVSVSGTPDTNDDNDDDRSAGGKSTAAPKFVWNSNRITLENTVTIDKPLGDVYRFGVAAFCPNESYHFWFVTVIVSMMNKMSPQFTKKMYSFQVPPNAKIGDLVGKVHAVDQDDIVYNSKIHYRVLTYSAFESLAMNEENGEMRLMKNMSQVDMKTLGILAVEACDYGSPQKCTSAEVEVLRVSLTSPKKVRVLTANPKYQITCWQAPQRGSPEIYFLRIINERINATRPQYRMDVKSSKMDNECAITHWSGKVGDHLSMLVSANTTDDQATSDPVPFVIKEEFQCQGMCHDHGKPYCVNDSVTGSPIQAEWNGAKYCTCEMIYEGTDCANTKKCKCEIRKSIHFGDTYWNETAISAKVGVPCPYGPPGRFMERYCMFDVQLKKPYWQNTEQPVECERKTETVTRLNSYSLLLQRSNITADTVKYITGKLETLLPAALFDREVAVSMLRLAEQLSAGSISQEPKIRLNSTRRLRKLISNYAQNAAIQGGRSSMRINSTDTEISIVYTNKSQDLTAIKIGQSMTYISLKIPDAVLNQATKIKHNRSAFNPMVKFFESEQSKQPYRSKKIRVATVRYRDHRFYPDAAGVVPSKKDDDDDELPCLDIFVQNLEYETKLNETISFSVDLREHYTQRKKMGRGSSRADSPMNPLAQKQYTCVYWNEKNNKWDTKGVSTYKRMDGDEFLVVCNTDHLTGFSILLDFNQKIILDDENQFALNLLSWIGCCCSIAGLLLTIITYTLFRYLHREKAVRILLNLCSSMLLMNLLFLLSSARPFLEYSMLFCIGLGMALHYITLSTLLWMGVEAAHMYGMLVHVFAMSERHFMLKRYSIAYGLPAFIVLIVAGLNYQKNYFNMNDNYCRLSPANKLVHYSAFLGPACLILMCNCGVFVCVLRVLYVSRDTKRPRAHYQGQHHQQQYAGQVQSAKPSNMIAQIRGALSVMVLLGVTWIFGAFSFGPARLPFMYAFCVLNSAQGFIIFLVRCLLYDETRGAWLMLLRSGKLKKYKGKTCYASTRSTENAANQNNNQMSSRRPAGQSGECGASKKYSHRQHCGPAYHPPAVKKQAPMRPRTSQTANRAAKHDHRQLSNEATTMLTTTTSDRCSLPNEKRPLLDEHIDDAAQSKALMKFIDETPRSASPALSHPSST